MRSATKEPTLILPEVAATALSGAAAGFVIAGVGGRLAMRLSAQIDRSAHGFTTEAGAIVGEFTLAGTVSFMVFVGLAGAVIVGLLWSLVSPWLPRDRRRRKVIGFVVAAALGGRFAVDGRNFDFVILDPALLQAAIFVILAGLTGIVAATIEPWMDRRVSTERVGARFAYWAIITAGAAFTVPFSFLFFSEESCGCLSPPWLVGGAIIALGLVWLARLVTGLRHKAEPRWLGVVGRGLVAIATIAGLAHLAGEVAHFA